VAVAPAAQAALPSLRDTYGPGIDPYATYEGQLTCATAVQAGTLDLAAMLRTSFPGTNPWTYIRSCTSGAKSEHKDGRAIDWMLDSTDPKQAAIAEQFIAWISASDRYGNPHAMARRLGIMYIIWKGQLLRFWKGSTVAWQPSSGHFDHIHISLGWPGARRTTSYWTKYYSLCSGGGQCPVTRLSGADRYSTSVAVGRAAAPTATTVVIASGDQASLVDGLTAGPLASALGAPLLFTARDGLPAAISADLLARSATNAVIVGGPDVVTENVVAQLRELDLAVERVSGATRYDTSAAVAARIRTAKRAAVSHVVVASGEQGHLVDALGGGGLASVDTGAVLLTRGDVLPAGVAAAIRSVGAQRATVMGGDAVVAPAVASAVASLGVTVTRAAGADRFATAAAAASLAYNISGNDRTTVVVASGLDANMVDAIPAAALGLPVVLGAQTVFPAASASWVSARNDLRKASLVGGTGALSAATLDQVYVALVS
jgi:putative cell wall-binding protein